MELIFENPQYLYLLLIIPIYITLHFIFSKYSQRKAILFANFKALKRVSGKYTLSTHTSLLILRLTIFILLIFSISGINLKIDGIGDTNNYVILIDTSLSMDTNYDDNLTRLDYSKKALITFVDNLPKRTKVGIVSFSSISSIESPIILKSENLIEIISKIQIDQNSGTNLGDAIYTSTNLFKNNLGTKKMIIITDGQNNGGSLIDKSLKYAKDENIIIYTVGIDGESRYKDLDLNFRINENELTNIANYTGGKFYKISNEINYLETLSEIKEIKEQKLLIKLEEPFMFLVIFFLIIEFIFIKTIYKITP